MTEAKITVCMPAFNSEKYIKESIDCVLKQTYKNFELLIVNDGSTDATESIINSYTDSRIKLLNNDGNKGLIYTRNRILSEVNTKYIAILDSDDICSLDRLEKQLNYLENNPEIAICGTWGVMIDENSTVFGHKIMPETNPDYINIEMLFRNQFIHSSVMYKKDVACSLGGYQSINGCEDYGLFSQISLHHKMANIPEFILKYREHTLGISKTNVKEISTGETAILKSLYQRFAINEELLEIPFSIIKNDFSKLNNENVSQFFLHLIKVNNEHSYYTKEHFNKVIQKYWYMLILQLKLKKNIKPFYSFCKNEKVKLSTKQIKKLIKLKLFK